MLRRRLAPVLLCALALACQGKGTDSAGSGGGAGEGGDDGDVVDEDEDDGEGDEDTAVEVVEDCSTPGDEEGDGVADCADSDCLGEPACSCVDADLGARASLALVEGTNRAQGDDWESTCATEAGAEDVVFSWAPPSSGCWRFALSSEDMAPVLSAARDTCDGPAHGCVDAVQAAAGELTLNLEEAESVVLAVDGTSAADAGSFTLGVELVDPLPWEPSIILGAATGSALHTGPNTVSQAVATPSCSTESTAMIVAWLAPADGTYTFDTAGSTIDTVVEVFTHCGRALGCSTTGASGVTVDLLEGESIKLAIWGAGGATGDVTVNVTQ